MINRYTVKKIEDIWNDENKLNIWLDVEKKVSYAWMKMGIVSQDEYNLISQNASINIQRMLEIEKETRHDVVAFTRAISETLGKEKKWIHLGLTSTDVVDTAQNKLIQLSNRIVVASLVELKAVLKDKALKYKNTLTMGRSHGIYGEPTSLGLKFLLWFDELNRQLERFYLARKQIEVAKISGSMGNYANMEFEIEEIVANEMGLGIDNISTQVTQRDRHAFLISVFANIASTLEKIATEIRLFQRSEVQEWHEGFKPNQKGSSSMPHKKNPISSENITGLSRYLRSFTNVAFENNVLWHERDISHSSNERIILSDIYNVLVYSLNRLKETLEELVIDEEKMLEHINSQFNVFYSQPMLNYILINCDESREEVYDFIQKCTFETMNSKVDFKESLIRNGLNKYVKDMSKIEEIFNINYFIRNVDKIYSRTLKK
ncbi:adenylosuccinate lyase [Mesoplasma chauliocola]|uniref:Adenylosuccinate lyase n=1 Tax=Mesoplasma chauliocola TaxID=216427 RepID=A0A249SMG3_9MOLU|nr:adenylosuccinate lyase [Mesoplasma chauliocola]ASZ08836.1 adenylosuccinate lyase [Mesoplasma chauliocola]